MPQLRERRKAPDGTLIEWDGQGWLPASVSAQPPSETPEPTLMDTALRVGSGIKNAVVEGVKGAAKLSGVPGLLREGPMGAIKDQAGMVRDIGQAQIDEYRKAKEAEATGRTPEMIGHSVAAAVPVFGPMAARWGEMIGSGKAPEAAGEMIVGALPLAHEAAPAVTRGAAQAVKATGRVVADTAREVATNPTAAVLGAVEGYQAGGPIGAVAGGVGLPMGLSGVRRALTKKATPAAAAAAEWAQEAKNLNARDAFIQKQAAQEAKDLSVHARMVEKMAAAQTKAEVVAAKQRWDAIIQEAKNLTAREKKMAQLASEETAASRVKDLTSPSDAASHPPTSVSELFDTIGSRMEKIGIKDAAADYRELSRKLVVSPEEAARLSALKQRMKLSASEAGLSYPAAQKPR